MVIVFIIFLLLFDAFSTLFLSLLSFRFSLILQPWFSYLLLSFRCTLFHVGIFFLSCDCFFLRSRFHCNCFLHPMLWYPWTWTNTFLLTWFWSTWPLRCCVFVTCTLYFLQLGHSFLLNSISWDLPKFSLSFFLEFPEFSIRTCFRSFFSLPNIVCQCDLLENGVILFLFVFFAFSTWNGWRHARRKHGLMNIYFFIQKHICIQFENMIGQNYILTDNFYCLK